MTGPEVNTDPRFIYADDSNVIAYRLGIVETNIQAMDVKLDRVINEYPTVTMLGLIIEPLKEKLKDLEDKREAEQEHKTRHEQQIKYLTYTAIAGPVGTFLITLAMGGMLGAFDGRT